MLLYLRGRKDTYNATCEYDNNLFTVKKGSIISTDSGNTRITKSAEVYRNDKNLVDSNHVVKKDITFKSATSAAQFVVGQSVNGKRAWKDKNNKKVLI